jgi:hypothetical protein
VAGVVGARNIIAHLVQLVKRKIAEKMHKIRVSRNVDFVQNDNEKFSNFFLTNSLIRGIIKER